MNINLDKQSKYVIAVSTGVDSMVLLDLAIKLKLDFVVAHVNHNKRDESIKEESFIREFCKNNNIVLEVFNFKYENKNFQSEARDQRYNFFYNVTVKYNATTILTAHHSYDNVESVLINILRGSNLKGYSGISNSSFKGIDILRPLLHFSKNDIYEYASSNNITYFEDSSNSENVYLRNNIRNNVLNSLFDINNNFDQKFLQYSNLLQESFSFIRDTSNKYIVNNRVNINEYCNLHSCIQKDILNILFENYNLSSSSNLIDDCIKVILNKKSNLTYNIKNNYRLIKEYDYFYLTNELSNKVNIKMCNNEKCEIPMYGVFYLTNKLPKIYTNYTKLCYNDIEFPLTIRTRLDGDKIIIKDGHKKVGNFFTDLKIPKEKRDKILLVCNNDNEILWIIDYYKKQVKGDFIYLVYEEDNYE